MKQYVALLDILGFKDMIMNNDHDEMSHLFNNFRIYTQMILAKHKSKTDDYGRAVFDLSESTVNSTIISDSLIFWTNDDSPSGLVEMIEYLQEFTSFCHNLPFIFLRGGITYGDFLYDNSGIIRGKGTLLIHHLMMGKALVEAHEIEKNLEIVGCIVTDKALVEAKAKNPVYFDQEWTRLISERKVIEYDMPTKRGAVKHWTLNWVRDNTQLTEEKLVDGFAQFKRGISDPRVKQKIANTLDYFSFIKQNIFHIKK